MDRRRRTGWLLGLCAASAVVAGTAGCLFGPETAEDGGGGEGAPRARLGAPVLFAPSADADNVSASLVLFSWSRVPGAVAYELYAGPDSNPPLLVTTDQTTYQLVDLPTCAVHYWRVVAVGETQRTSSPVRRFTTRCPPR